MPTFNMIIGEEVVLTGDEYFMREKIEDMLDEKFGFAPSLQEDCCEEEKLFWAYVHSDTNDTLTEKEINHLIEHGIEEDDDDGTWEAIQEIFDMKIEMI